MHSKSKIPGRFSLYAHFVFLIVLFPSLAFFSMYYGEPKSIFPSTYPLLLVFVASVSDFGGEIAFLLSVATLSAGTFYIFCYDLITKNNYNISRFLVAIFIVISTFNALYIFVSFNYSLKYQGGLYSYLCVFWNLIFFIAAALLLWFSRKKSSFHSALIFRWILVAWPITVAFPWMGETF